MNTNKTCSKIVMMNGSIAGDIISAKSSCIVEKFAALFKAEEFVFPAPLVVDSKTTANLINNDSHGMRARLRGGSADCALQCWEDL